MSLNINSIGRVNSVADTIYGNIDKEIAKMARKAHIAMIYIIAPSFAGSPMSESIYKYLTSNFSNDSFKQIIHAT